jgi:translation initiation factor IF-3
LPANFITLWRWTHISTELIINEGIRDREVRVIGADGAQLGVMLTEHAMQLAEDARLDLVKIVPKAQPPVCKLMDFDKHRFEQAKREKEMRRNQKTITLKEVQLSATIEENDILTKAKSAVKFLKAGDKVKVTIRFRGRQITHSEIGHRVMKEFAERISDVAVIERMPNLEGRHMIMFLAPKQEKLVKSDKETQPQEPQA